MDAENILTTETMTERARKLAARAEVLRATTRGAMRAEHALNLAADACALSLALAARLDETNSRLDALTPYLDETFHVPDPEPITDGPQLDQVPQPAVG